MGALTEWSAFIAAASEKGLQVPPVTLVAKGIGTNNLYLMEVDQVTGGLSFSGTVTQSGLHIAGRVTEVSVNPTTWTLLPASPLSARNAMAIQNYSGQQIKLNYDPLAVGYVGVIIDDSNERFYDITDTIPIYAKSVSSVVTIIVEELS